MPPTENNPNSPQDPPPSYRVQHLVRALKQPDRYARRMACLELGKIGDATAVPALLIALDDNNEYACAETAKALGKIGDPRAVQKLTELLRKGIMARHMCIALGNIGDDNAVLALVKALIGCDKYKSHSAA